MIPNALIEDGLERLTRYTTRDREFEAHMGKWTRPPHLRRYPLERFQSLIRWHPADKSTLDVAPLIRSLDKHDRFIAGEIARFVAEEFLNQPASDTVLHRFACQYLRRLDSCGF